MKWMFSINKMNQFEMVVITWLGSISKAVQEAVAITCTQKWFCLTFHSVRTHFYETEKRRCGFSPFPCPSSRLSHLKIFTHGYIMVMSLPLGFPWLKNPQILSEGIIQNSHFTTHNYDPNHGFCINIPYLASRSVCLTVCQDPKLLFILDHLLTKYLKSQHHLALSFS